MAKKNGSNKKPTLQEYLAQRAAFVRDSAATAYLDKNMPEVPRIPSQNLFSKGLAFFGASDDTRYMLAGAEDNPYTCIYTTTKQYGDRDAEASGNITFRDSPEAHGFRAVPMDIDSVSKGDLVQFTPKGYSDPDHAAMITGTYWDPYNEKALPTVSYSRGGVGAETVVNGEAKPTMVHGKPLTDLIQESGTPTIYRYYGSPSKQKEWVNEYNQKYPKKENSFRTGTTLRWAEGGFLQPRDAWDTLSMREKAEMMKIAVNHGIYNFSDIRQKYNEFAEGGSKEEEEEVNTNSFSSGGSIHIKPSHRGRLTELKKRTGKTEAELYRTGSPATRKMITFARNARKWKHGEGGPLVDMAMNSYAPGGDIVYGHPYYSYNDNGQLVRDENGKPILNYNVTLPNVVVTPDNKKSPAERAVLERERRRSHDRANGQGAYNAEMAKEWTGLQQLIAQKEWENSLEKQALDYAQAAATGIGIGADIVSGLPIYSSLKGARVLSEAKTPTDYIEGGLWLTPVTGGIYHTAKPAISKTVNHIVNQAQSIGREMGNPFEFAEGIYNYARREPILFAEKEAAAQRMDAFIHSPEYIQKQKAAGLSDSEIADFQDMIARRLNGGNFPAYRMKRKSNGLSLSLPKPFGGIYMRKGIPADDFLNAFDHEVAHYSTVNFGKTDNELLKWLNKENPTVMEKVMGYNINSVPYRPKADVSKVRTARGLSPDTEKLNYFRDEQELRSNAYAMLQEAQRRGISIDELIDQYTMQSTGEIFGHAPAPLRYLNYAYTPENMKKFIKSFLSVSTPVTIGIKATTQNDNE